MLALNLTQRYFTSVAGLVSEKAVVTIVWPHLAMVATMDAKVASLSAAPDAYCAPGYTGMIEMAMDEGGWEAALELRRQRGGVLPPNAEANKGGNAGRNRPRSRSPRPVQHHHIA
ncbi:hypothetical protein Cpir12675_006978 [Ceratocystis pirilliformis]|uniref:Uncharacterized protein n=1 Tax=Ceratocystis pirilliformis TaxID=259994 RepID=A0ABR3YAL1_9PEZI